MTPTQVEANVLCTTQQAQFAEKWLRDFASPKPSHVPNSIPPTSQSNPLPTIRTTHFIPDISPFLVIHLFTHSFTNTNVNPLSPANSRDADEIQYITPL